MPKFLIKENIIAIEEYEIFCNNLKNKTAQN